MSVVRFTPWRYSGLHSLVHLRAPEFRDCRASRHAARVGAPVVAINTGTLTDSLAVALGPTATLCWLRATVSGAPAPVSGFIQATVDTSSGSIPGFQQISVM
jgi:hypothetical protein